MIFQLLVFCFVALPSQTILASTKDGVHSEPDHPEMVVLVVDKSKLRADLKTWPEEDSKAHHLVTFRIALGKSEGDKQIAGDNRTPEGIYFAQSFIDGSTLPAKYGPKAIPINFPNPLDQRAGKTGHGIWLHGVEQDTRINEAKVTEGCVVFYNADIMALTRWLKPFQAVVIIGSTSDALNKPEDVTSLRGAAKGWAEAWAKRDLKGYVDKYAASFEFNGMGLKDYGEYKGRVFAGYKKMDVKLTDLRVFTHAKYGMTVVNQDFNGDERYVSRGRKVLYWQRDATGWKIQSEVFEHRRLEFVSFNQAELTQFTSTSPSAKYFTDVQSPTNL